MNLGGLGVKGLELETEKQITGNVSDYKLTMLLFANIVICLIAWNVSWFNLSITIPEVELVEEATMEVDLDKTNVTIYLSSDFGIDKWSVNKEFQNNDCEGKASQFLKCKQRKDASFLARTMIVLSVFSTILIIWGTWPRKYQVSLDINFLKYIPPTMLALSGILWSYIMLWSTDSEGFDKDIFDVFSNVPSITENIPIKTEVTLFGPIFTVVTGTIMIGMLIFMKKSSKHVDV